jgi:hypothetical protein
MANCFAFAIAAAFKPATPPVFAIAATFNPTRIIFPIFLKRLRERPFTIYDPFALGKAIAFLFSCGAE